MENRLRLLYALQRVDSNLDELHELKGDLPHLVEVLEKKLQEKDTLRKSLEATMKHSQVRRDEIDLEIVTTKEKIEKYKEQQFQIKTNKQYDALTREIDLSQERVKTLEKEMETIEGKAANAKTDLETLAPELQDLRKELKERQAELDHVNKEHEDEELKLKHEREKLIVRIDKSDVKSYERIRKALGGKAVVGVRRNACGGCFKRVPPQVSVELRKNSRLMTCENCGRLLVSDDIVESYTNAI
ncbi:MAG: C4-type zinc ribbon domain-containing protein [Ignavibacteriales bacterium]|nr:C4-type zinc ribbon domain-containing protein [Ignavibacteriales bacterium]